MDFSNEIISWYSQNKRDLPWRNTTNPYYIWLSEIILQQTRVDQGLPYYLNFVKAFPTVEDLAKAKEDTVLKLWQGLGYYSRARNLHIAANQVVNDFDGKFPTTKKELLALKGVGDYTASAIASFCFKEVAAVVDGNVYRVLSRFFGIELPIDTPLGQKEFKTTAQTVINQHTPDIHNQAIMEFGALMCTPKKPNCSSCPLVLECIAHKEETIDKLPFKSKKVKQRNRYFTYLVLNEKEHIYLNQRGPNDIWQNLFEFPLIETLKESTPTEIATHLSALGINNYTIKHINKLNKHILSHQIIYAKFIQIDIDKLSDKNGFTRLKKVNIHNFATHRLMEKYLNSNFEQI
jgi:A/G-specific adenine glycosylase